MGFNMRYPEMPKLVLHLLFILAHLRRLSSWLRVRPRLDGAANASNGAATASDADRQRHPYHAATAKCLDEHSPVVRFDSLSSSAGEDGGGETAAPLPLPLPEGCCVCLGDFHAAAEVRRVRGCLHVFHRACLDRWAAHGHRTCPLCRTPLLLPLPPPPS